MIIYYIYNFYNMNISFIIFFKYEPKRVFEIHGILSASILM